MIYSEKIKETMILSNEYALSKFDEIGFPLCEHIYEVANFLLSEDQIVVALLFEFVNEEGFFNKISNFNFNDNVVSALKCFINGDDYLEKIKHNEIASKILVKSILITLDKNKATNRLSEENIRDKKILLEKLGYKKEKSKDYRKDKDKYFEYYDDIKSHRHKVYDW